jgi:argininosuccinate lyase
MNAVDLADLLCRECGLAFREAHNIIARAVKLSSDTGFISLESLKQAFLESGHDSGRLPENIAEFQDPSTLIQARNHTGSPAPEQVQGQIKTMKEELEQLALPMNHASQRAEKAWLRCRNEIPA